MATPNMGIAYPSPSVTTGPQWASLINASFDTVDGHDHTSTKGVKVPTGGLNIDADLSMASNNLTAIRSLRLNNQSATLSGASDLNIVYSKNGELTYRDASGNEVVITNAGSVAGATGTISGLSSPASASYNATTGTFSFLKDTAKPGKFVTSDLLVYEYNNAAANPITVKSPDSLAAAYTLTLPPAVPSQSGVVVMGTGGGLGTGLVDGLVSAPGLSFASELSTGLYRPSAGQLALAGTGAQLALFTATTVTLSGIVQSAAGAVGAPAYAFSGDTNTGLYNASADILAFTTGGVRRGDFSSAGLKVTADSSSSQLFLERTGVGAGGMKFQASTAELDILDSANTVYATFSGAGFKVTKDSSSADITLERTGASAGGVVLSGSTVALSIATIGGTNIATLSTSGLEIAGGGAIKIKVLSFSNQTIALNSTATIGTISGTIVSISGSYHVTGDPNNNYPILPQSLSGVIPSGTEALTCVTDSSGNVIVRNRYDSFSSSSFTGSVVIIYQ